MREKILMYVFAVVLVFFAGFWAGSEFSRAGGMRLALSGASRGVEVTDSIPRIINYEVISARRLGDTLSMPDLVIPVTADSVIAQNLNNSVTRALDSLRNQSVEIIHTERFVTLTADTIDVAYSLTNRSFLEPELRKAPVVYSEIAKTFFVPVLDDKSFFESPWVAGGLGFVAGVTLMNMTQNAK